MREAELRHSTAIILVADGQQGGKLEAALMDIAGNATSEDHAQFLICCCHLAWVDAGICLNATSYGDAEGALDFSAHTADHTCKGQKSWRLPR